MVNYSTPLKTLLNALGWSSTMLFDRRFPICDLDLQYVPMNASFLVVYRLRHVPHGESVGSIEDKCEGFPSAELLASLALVAGPVHDLVAEAREQEARDRARTYEFYAHRSQRFKNFNPRR